ncbi:MAG TPA: choice-of-anchor Q domain-containing protein [Kofleriaceae bacterium]
MRNVILVTVLGLVACTKPNPNRCCTDEADCEANDIPAGSTCADGLVCRGNQCIAETCTASSACESTDPFCVSGLCADSCTDDSQCPGAGDDPSLTHCTGGVCVACATNTDCPASTPACVDNVCLDCAMDSDCPASTPICDMNACRICQTDAECDSQVCDVDHGTCVDAGSIRYASPTGPDTADCSQATPCSMTRAAAIVDIQHPWLRMLPGTFTGTMTLSIASVEIVGTGATLMGEISAMSSEVDVRGLAIVATAASAYNAFVCRMSSGVIRDVNFQGATDLTSCMLTIDQIIATSVDVRDHNDLMIDRSSFLGVDLVDPTTLTLTMTNSIAHRFDVELSQQSPSVTVNVSYSTFYCTTADCGGGAIVSCETLPAAEDIHFTNNVFYDPGTVVGGAVVADGNAGTNLCTFTNNVTYPQTDVIAGNIALDPKFVDAANGDFHLTATSPAIDTAIVTGTDPTVDYDGTARPQGARDDIGAFEYKP